DIKNEASAKTGSGRISLYKIGGDLDLGAGSGDILAEEVKGSARAHTGSGRITLRSVDGDVSVRTGSGDAEIKGAAGNVSAHMASGSLRIESALGEGVKWDVVAGSGGVRLLLPANSEFALHARTGSGMLKTDFPISTSGVTSRKELQGTVGRPKAD